MSKIGTLDLTWRRLHVLLHHLPEKSALHRSLNGDAAGWGLQEQLLAVIADATAIGNWQRGGDRKVPRPKPIPRPGVKTDDTVDKKYGTVLPIEDARSFFAARRAAQAAQVGKRADGDEEPVDIPMWTPPSPGVRGPQDAGLIPPYEPPDDKDV